MKQSSNNNINNNKCSFTKLTISLFLIILSLNNIKSNNTNNLKSNNNNNNNNQVYKSNLTITQANNLWEQLFSKPRGNSCQAPLKDLSPNTKPNTDDDQPEEINSAWGTEKRTFNWLRNYGFGKVAYLIDYLDNVFRDEFISEATNIINDITKISKEDTPKYSDPYKLSVLPTFKSGNKLLTDEDYKLISPKFIKQVYESSFNANQLYKAITEWKWFTEEGVEDAPADLISRYDINGDGVLNYKEILYAAIRHNAFNPDEDTVKCFNCAAPLAKKLDAMFLYLDCENKGYLTSEDLWKKLPLLKRKSGVCNIFKNGNSLNIRTDSINDFIIKNARSIDGAVSKKEFRNGILFAFIERQITETSILKDDSKNLKKLRWSNNLMTDIMGTKFIKDSNASK